MLVVGAVDRRNIPKHARLRAYEASDFDRILSVIDLFPGIVVPPQVLGQASDLIRYRVGGAQAVALDIALSTLVSELREEWIRSVRVVTDEDYARLGLTDAVLLMSADLSLCLAAEQRGARAINYSHLRDGAWTLEQIEEFARN